MTRRALLVVLVVCVAGCGTKTWTLKTTQPTVGLQWPYQPNKAKITYARSLSGLAPDTDSQSVLNAIVFGREEEDRYAFVLPVAVATGDDGRIAVADLGRKRVHLYLPVEKRYVPLTGSEDEPMTSPVGVVFDEAMNLFVSDSTGKLFVFGPGGGLLRTVRHAGAEKLLRPTGIAYSPRKKLVYVADTLANRVHGFGSNGDYVLSFGERGDAKGQFNFPTHIFWAPSGELYVTDSMNFRVEIFSEEGKNLGAFGHHGDGSGDLGLPKGLAVDREGAVYVVDGLFDHVQLFDRQGAFLLAVGQRGTDFGEFWLPSGAFINEKNELYVCDTYNRRVQVFRIRFLKEKEVMRTSQDATRPGGSS